MLATNTVQQLQYQPLRLHWKFGRTVSHGFKVKQKLTNGKLLATINVIMVIAVVH